MATAPSPAPVDECAPQWMPGDYAECTAMPPWWSLQRPFPRLSGPTIGDVCQVRKVVVKSGRRNDRIQLYLVFERWPDVGFPCAAFRKSSRPRMGLSAIRRFVRRDPHIAGVGAAAIVTAVCYGAAAVAQIFGSDQ